MRDDPQFATFCGDHRFNNRLTSVSVTAFDKRAAQARHYLSRLQAMDRATLPSGEQLNYDLFQRELQDAIAEHEFGAHLMPLSKASGIQTYFPDLPLVVPLESALDYENYLSRLGAFKDHVAEYLELMRAGVGKGLVPPRAVLEGCADAIRALLVPDPVHSVFFKPFERFPAHLGEGERSRLAEGGKTAIRESLIPGYQALLDFLIREYLPAARETIAASALPNGREFYKHRVRMYTTLRLSPREVHETGLSEVRRIREEMAAVLRKVGFQGNFQAFLQFLRTDPRFYVGSPEDLLKHVALILKKMDGELPGLFGRLPRMPYGIRPTPEHSAPTSTTAFYFPPTGDGSRAGFYYVNTYDLPSRPLYEYEALSLHEAVPGHHLQIALQMELDLPPFRRFGGVTAFIEGWALYAERLGLETGFYQDPYSDFGRLTYEIWRACRLVVDTGVHFLGWSRPQAIDYLTENTGLSPLNIANEVDRYIAWPGQALAYKIGELKIRGLRAFAEQGLRSAFRLREFHDLLLEEGSIPMEILEARVKAWVSASQKSG